MVPGILPLASLTVITGALTEVTGQTIIIIIIIPQNTLIGTKEGLQSADPNTGLITGLIITGLTVGNDAQGLEADLTAGGNSFIKNEGRAEKSTL